LKPEKGLYYNPRNAVAMPIRKIIRTKIIDNETRSNEKIKIKYLARSPELAS